MLLEIGLHDERCPLNARGAPQSQGPSQYRHTQTRGQGRLEGQLEPWLRSETLSLLS